MWVVHNTFRVICKLPEIIPKDHKDVISLIMKYQKDLETLITYSDNPMPTLYSQAVHLAVWSFLIFGMISGTLQYDTKNIIYYPYYYLNIYVVSKLY